MTVDKQGLEEAAKALYEDDDAWSAAFSWPDLAEGQTSASRYRELASTAITAYLSALPPVDGLEVVAELNRIIAEEAEDFADAAGHAIEAGERPDLWDREVEVAVHTLSKASSVIAGLRSERITAERDALEAYRKLQTAEARIAELEAAIDSAEIAGGLTENGNLWRFWSQKAQETAGKAEARISSLEEENKRMREALDLSLIGGGE